MPLKRINLHEYILYTIVLDQSAHIRDRSPTHAGCAHTDVMPDTPKLQSETKTLPKARTQAPAARWGAEHPRRGGARRPAGSAPGRGGTPWSPALARVVTVVMPYGLCLIPCLSERVPSSTLCCAMCVSPGRSTRLVTFIAEGEPA